MEILILSHRKRFGMILAHCNIGHVLYSYGDMILFKVFDAMSDVKLQPFIKKYILASMDTWF